MLQGSRACRANEPAAGLPDEIDTCAEHVASEKAEDSSSHDLGCTAGKRSPASLACEASPTALTAQADTDSAAVPEQQHHQQQQRVADNASAQGTVMASAVTIASHAIDCSNRCSLDAEASQQLIQAVAGIDLDVPCDPSPSGVNASHKPGIQQSDEEGSASTSHSEFSATAAPQVQPPAPAAGTYTRASHGMATSSVAAEDKQLASEIQQVSNSDGCHATTPQASTDMAAAYAALEAALKQQAEQAAAREAAARAQVCCSLSCWCKHPSIACRAAQESAHAVSAIGMW